MGAGKTCVVSPLLALILPDSRKLCIQVVPAALLDFSRGTLHKVLSLGFGKGVRTFLFERKHTIDASILQKMQDTANSGSVMVTTPSSLKALLLKFVECLFNATDEGYAYRRQAKHQIEEASRLFQFLRKSILIMDEVDTVLHPLKSELNFPVGKKLSLELSPMRWNFPLFLIDTFLRSDLYIHSLGQQNRMIAAVEELRSIIDSGAKNSSLQRRPHLILLSRDYYQERMLPAFAKIALLWCEKQEVNVKLARSWIEDYLTAEEGNLQNFEHQFQTCAIMDRSIFNLVRHWLHLILPHILQKVNRVTFGLMTPQECTMALKSNPHMPRARMGLAIPFVGKDTPSESSEFAHPDVVIGLTILAYRYDGLRLDDFLDLLRNLHASLDNEIGPKQLRPSSLRFEQWVKECHAVVADVLPSGKRTSRQNLIVVHSLKNLRATDKPAIKQAFELLRKCRSVINFYLAEFIFPRFMKHQKIKLSASAQELGSNLLFEKRIGFSGTPSSLIPLDLGECQFEPGSEATIFQNLSSTKICGISYENDSDWTPKSVLDKVLKDGIYNALIDTGALITGYSNFQVAKYLLMNGLRNRGIDGIVYLDELDRKMVLVAATDRSVKLEECGIDLNRRFVFYDQIHTTGMDIKHAPNARALITLGKDMVFRDLAQGAYRMRGIGKGQTLDYFIIPEISRLIEKTASKSRSSQNPDVTNLQLSDILIWLLLNSMRSEKLQYNQLVLQNAANVFRKQGFQVLSQGAATPCSSFKRSEFVLSREVFRELISFEIPGNIPKSVGILDKILEIEAQFRVLMESDLQSQKEIETIKNSLMFGSLSLDAKTELDQEMQQEQVLSVSNLLNF